jgi:hypothetical protein
VFWKHSEHWRLLVDDQNRIVGYWEMHLLFDEFYEEIKLGRLAEDELSTEMMPDFHFGGIYPAYLSMVGIEPGFMKQGIRLLTESFFFVLLEGARNGLFVSEITARAWTQAGKRLCRQMGMKKVQKADGAVVDVEHWSGSMCQILEREVDRYRAASELLDLYRQQCPPSARSAD